MTATLIKSGDFAFDGIHVRKLEEGTSLTPGQHFAEGDDLVITTDHIDALLNLGRVKASAEAAPTAPVAQPEGDSAKPEEKAADPAEANKAIHPVTENKAHKGHAKK